MRTIISSKYPATGKETKEQNYSKDTIDKEFEAEFIERRHSFSKFELHEGVE